MRIQDLEEWQGVTRDLFRAWLTKSGWKELETVRPGCAKWSHWSGTCLGTISDGRLAASIECVAIHYRRSVQSILVELNPRMRKGKPYDLEIEAHVQNGGIWIATRGDLGNGGTICFINFYWDTGCEDPGPFTIWDGQEWNDTDWDDGYDLAEWSFWPCDAHGNKVPWPLPARSGEGGVDERPKP